MKTSNPATCSWWDRPNGVSDYDKRGYLDLEHLLVRLKTHCIFKFYWPATPSEQNNNTPRHWQFPDSRNWSNARADGRVSNLPIDVKKGGRVPTPLFPFPAFQSA